MPTILTIVHPQDVTDISPVTECGVTYNPKSKTVHIRKCDIHYPVNKYLHAILALIWLWARSSDFDLGIPNVKNGRMYEPHTARLF